MSLDGSAHRPDITLSLLILPSSDAAALDTAGTPYAAGE
jgi:hypothetical protein